MSDDASLRRMVYLFIKEVAETCNPDDVIIVTSSLTKDMTCDVDLYRANALRVLARIIDSAMLGAIERYVKQAIVDSSGQVSSAALVSSLHLYEAATENAVVVKRWIGEVQEATTSPNVMVQFHGMQLLYKIKSSDRLGVSKLVQQFSSRNSLKSPLAVVSLQRDVLEMDTKMDPPFVPLDTNSSNPVFVINLKWLFMRLHVLFALSPKPSLRMSTLQSVSCKCSSLAPSPPLALVP